MNKIIFQYCRVSTTEQSSDGKGIENQKRENERYIQQLIKSNPSLVRGEDIVETESAFSGKNFKRITDDFEDGKIPKGSIVVMFDHTRFSREDPLDALYKLRELVRNGLNIGFSAKSELITQEKVNSFTGYITHLVSAATANEESQHRRNRALASYNRRVEDNELVLSGALPNWIRKVYKEGKIVGIEAIPERKVVIQKMFSFYNEGKGATSIVKWLNENEPVWKEHHNRVRANKKVKKLSDKWTESYVTRLLTDRRLIGERIFNIGKSIESVKNDYYPKVISKAVFYQAQEIRKNRRVSPTMRKYPPLIFMGLANCGYCGSRIAVQQYTNKTPSIRCARHNKGEEDLCAGGSSQAKHLEAVLIDLCRDKVNFNLLFQEQERDIKALKEELRLAIEVKENNEKKQSELLDLKLDGQITEAVFKAKNTDIMEKLLVASKSIKSAELQIDKAQNYSVNEREEFIKLLDQLETNKIPVDQRLRLKALLPQFIERIDVYRYGLFAKPKVTKKKYQELINEFGENHFKVLKAKPPTKNKAKLTYRIVFKSGDSRYVQYNAGDYRYIDSQGGELKLNNLSDPTEMVFNTEASPKEMPQDFYDSIDPDLQHWDDILGRHNIAIYCRTSKNTGSLSTLGMQREKLLKMVDIVKKTSIDPIDGFTFDEIKLEGDFALSGTRINEGLESLLEQLNFKDSVLISDVTRISRLATDSEEFKALVDKLYDEYRTVCIYDSKTEGLREITKEEFIVKAKSSFKEYKSLEQRGVNGRQVNTERKENRKEQCYQMLTQGMPQSVIADTLGIGKSTVSIYVKELKNEGRIPDKRYTARINIHSDN